MSNDAELMRQIAARGSEAEKAFDSLLGRHQSFVMRRLTKMVRDQAASEDLLQEVFLRLWSRAEQWDGRGSLRAWLGRVATNLALNHLRTVRRRRLLPLQRTSAAEGDSPANPPDDWLVDGSTLQPADAAAAAEIHDRLRQLLQSLPADQRDVMHMVHRDDMNLREAAEELGIPVGTVKSRLHHARQALAKQWQALQERMGDL